MNNKINSPFQFQHSYANLGEFFYKEQIPEKVSNPQLVLLNQGLADELGIDLTNYNPPQLAAIFSGNIILDSSLPIAQAYAGHQFGQFTMLGDGRAILLGEHVLQDETTVDIQLKGAGRTPFSRAGDGRATLGPMLREFLISEALHALRIPTSRSLAVVVTGDPVYRERPLPGAILTRVANSHIRVGTFQYAQVFGDENAVQELADYTIERHFPDIASHSDCYASLLRKVIHNQAETIAKWQLVGFIHGVMNTDNMTISGETIDYGPCAFIDTYNPNTVFSSIDHQGRYAYRNQPPIGMWNITRFAETLLPLLHEDEEEAVTIARSILHEYEKSYMLAWMNGMRQKLGLQEVHGNDIHLMEDLLKWMEKEKIDYTNMFIALTFRDFSQEVYEDEDFQSWLERYNARLEKESTTDVERQAMMKAHNPAIIPRNYFVEEALNQVVNKQDFSRFHALMEVLKKPYAHTEEQKQFAILPPEADGPYQTYCGT